MDWISGQVIDDIGTFVVLSVIALAVITDKLVWHTRLKKEEARADRWEKAALEALNIGAAAGVRAAEVAVDVVSALPDPLAREQGGVES